MQIGSRSSHVFPTVICLLVKFGLEGLEKFRMLSAKVAKKGMFELLGKQF